MAIRLVGCSRCFKNYPLRKTTIVGHKRVCHDCRHKEKKNFKVIVK